MLAKPRGACTIFVSVHAVVLQPSPVWASCPTTTERSSKSLESKIVGRNLAINDEKPVMNPGPGRAILSLNMLYCYIMWCIA